MQIAEDTKFAQVRTHVNYRLKAEADDQALSWIRYSTTLGWTKMHDVFKSLLPRYFLKDIYVK